MPATAGSPEGGKPTGWSKPAGPDGIPVARGKPLPTILDVPLPSRKEAASSMARTILLLLTAGISACLPGWTAGRPRAAEMLAASVSSITAADAARHVEALADDAFEGREGGSRGGRAAAAYIVEQIEPLGFEPAGEAGSWYQPFGAGLRNVLALLPGRDPALARELVVVGAHYDHVGYGTERNSFGPFGFVHNGADDNASGVGGLIEVMEALQRLPEPPRRSILIAFWDGEEKGLLGSNHFVRVRPEPLADCRPVFSINLDMIGRLRNDRLVVYGARTSPELRRRLVGVNNDPRAAAGLELAFDWDILEDSDHYPFIAARIPTVMFHTGLHDQYHRPSDDVELINFAGIPPVARLTLALVTAIADEDQRPTFRAASQAESNATRRRLEERRPPGGPSRGRWGIVTRADPCEPSTPIVVDVREDAPAQRAGLRPGDRLLSVDGQSFADQAGMVDCLKRAGDDCLLEIDRRGRVIGIELASAAERSRAAPRPSDD